MLVHRLVKNLEPGDQVNLGDREGSFTLSAPYEVESLKSVRGNCSVLVLRSPDGRSLLETVLRNDDSVNVHHSIGRQM